MVSSSLVPKLHLGMHVWPKLHFDPRIEMRRRYLTGRVLAKYNFVTQAPFPSTTWERVPSGDLKVKGVARSGDHATAESTRRSPDGYSISRIPIVPLNAPPTRNLSPEPAANQTAYRRSGYFRPSLRGKANGERRRREEWLPYKAPNAQKESSSLVSVCQEHYYTVIVLPSDDTIV